LDDTEFNLPQHLAHRYISVNGGTFVRQIDFSINFRQWPEWLNTIYLDFRIAMDVAVVISSVENDSGSIPKPPS
jgi:hypothetical protein